MTIRRCFGTERHVDRSRFSHVTEKRLAALRERCEVVKRNEEPVTVEWHGRRRRCLN